MATSVEFCWIREQWCSRVSITISSNHINVVSEIEFTSSNVVMHCVAFQGWRWSFYISGTFGVMLGVLIFFTIQEPQKRLKDDSSDKADIYELNGGEKVTWKSTATLLCRYVCTPTFLVFCLAGSFVKAGKFCQCWNSIGSTEADADFPWHHIKYISTPS